MVDLGGYVIILTGYNFSHNSAVQHFLGYSLRGSLRLSPTLWSWVEVWAGGKTIPDSFLSPSRSLSPVKEMILGVKISLLPLYFFSGTLEAYSSERKKFFHTTWAPLPSLFPAWLASLFWVIFLCFEYRCGKCGGKWTFAPERSSRVVQQNHLGEKIMPCHLIHFLRFPIIIFLVFPPSLIQ